MQSISIGDEFSLWTVMQQSDPKNGKRAVVCMCRCGTVKTVLVQNLLSRQSTSCGCHRAEVARKTKKLWWQNLGSKMRSTDQEL